MAKAKTLEASGNISYEFNGQELLEVSQVTVPSNADALQSFKGIGLAPELEAIASEIMDEMHVEEQVAEIAQQPSLVQAEFDYEALARQIAPLLTEELRMILAEKESPGPRKPRIEQATESIPSAEDVVKQVIAEYRRVL